MVKCIWIRDNKISYPIEEALSMPRDYVTRQWIINNFSFRICRRKDIHMSKKTEEFVLLVHLVRDEEFVTKL